MLNIRCVKVGLLGTNCYLVSNSNDVIVIDPGASFNKINELIKGKNLVAVLLTHGHFDHIGALQELIDTYHPVVYCHIKDKVLVENGKANGSTLGSRVLIEVLNGVTYFSDSINIEGFNIKTIYTPGHTKGCVSYLFDDEYMFTGDFLFKGVVGRTDLYNASESLMKDSCKKIIKYSDDIVIYPGHGDSTTLKDEKENNEYLKKRG